MLKELFPKCHHSYSSLPILGSILDEFIQFLFQHGYSRTTIRCLVCAVRNIDYRLQQQGCLSISEITQLKLLACAPTTKKSKKDLLISGATKQLQQYFIDEKGISLPQSTPSLIEKKIIEYGNYLLHVRGLAPSTIRGHCWIALRFINSFNKGLAHLAKLTSQDIEDFIHGAALGVSRGWLKKNIVYLRSFLRFLIMIGEIPIKLDFHIDAPRIYQEEQLPRALDWKIVLALLQSIDRSTGIGKRDYAMLLLMATYGLRACDVVALKLDDIDWRHNCLRIFQRKTATSLSLPLTLEVGKSIISYLRHGRPSAPCREIFVRHKAPNGILKPTCVYEVFQTWSLRSGLAIPPQGAHCLRYSYAVHLLRQGTSLKTIGDILGHRNLQSTTTYLRLAIDDLRTVPLNLPTAVISKIGVFS